MEKLWLRLKNASLFFLCLLSVLRHGRRSQVSKAPPGKVVVVMLAKLGDMVCITPVFRALKTHFPEVKVCVIGNKVNQDLLSNNRDVDEYIVFDEKRLLETVRILSRKNIDVAIIRGLSLSGLALALLSGIPTIVAPHVKEGKTLQTKTYKILLPFVITKEYVFGKYMPQQMLQLLEPIGIHSTNTTKHLGYSDKAEKTIVERFKANGIKETDLVVGITPSAGNKVKEWPVDRFAAVADHLIKNHKARVVLIGGPEDQEIAQTMLQHMQHSEAVMNTQGQCTIEELKALIAKLDLFISADTGPIYIAEAFNVPTIDITGPIDEREQPPIGKNHIVVTPPERKRPELYVLNARDFDYKEARRQTESITVERVTQEIDALCLRIHKNKAL